MSWNKTKIKSKKNHINDHSYCFFIFFANQSYNFLNIEIQRTVTLYPLISNQVSCNLFLQLHVAHLLYSENTLAHKLVVVHFSHVPKGLNCYHILQLYISEDKLPLPHGPWCSEVVERFRWQWRLLSRKRFLIVECLDKLPWLRDELSWILRLIIYFQ